MPFCPKCRYEFEAGNFICPDCNRTLIDNLPQKTVVAEIPDDSWVVVGSLVSGHRSKVAKGSLDSNNIPSVILTSQYSKDWGVDLLAGMKTNSGREVVLVPREYLEEAEIILETVLGRDFRQLDNHDEFL